MSTPAPRSCKAALRNTRSLHSNLGIPTTDLKAPLCRKLRVYVIVLNPQSVQAESFVVKVQRNCRVKLFKFVRASNIYFSEVLNHLNAIFR